MVGSTLALSRHCARSMGTSGLNECTRCIDFANLDGVVSTDLRCMRSYRFSSISLC